MKPSPAIISWSLCKKAEVAVKMHVYLRVIERRVKISIMTGNHLRESTSLQHDARYNIEYDVIFVLRYIL